MKNNCGIGGDNGKKKKKLMARDVKIVGMTRRI